MASALHSRPASLDSPFPASGKKRDGSCNAMQTARPKQMHVEFVDQWAKRLDRGPSAGGQSDPASCGCEWVQPTLFWPHLSLNQQAGGGWDTHVPRRLDASHQHLLPCMDKIGEKLLPLCKRAALLRSGLTSALNSFR